MAHPTSGYAVSLAGYEQRIPLTRYSIDLARSIYAYVVHHGNALREPLANLGAWVDHNAVVLDVSYVVGDRDTALRFAAINGQQSVYDLALGVDIPVVRSAAIV